MLAGAGHRKKNLLFFKTLFFDDSTKKKKFVFSGEGHAVLVQPIKFQRLSIFWHESDWSRRKISIVLKQWNEQLAIV